MDFDPRKQTCAPTIVESQRVEIGHDMDSVYLEIGGHRMTMNHVDALKLSAMIKLHGKQAKKFARDTSRIWTNASLLTDAELNYKRGF